MPIHAVAIPDHQLIRCIGQGSYGAVWLGRSSTGILRAIKIVFRSSFEDARPFEREWSGIQKFEPISRSHEGFIDVLHVGLNESEGYFYYIMELGDDEVSGTNIDPHVYAPKTLAREISSRRRLPVKDCLKLGLALSEALAELHRYDLVHRDIKPSNIIFVNGIPKLADIGLVAGANEARSFVGTEGFIPPEGPGTPRADIYSLGKVLYEASTGRDRQDFPELPTNWDDPAEHAQLVELNEVVLQACKTEVSHRYASARDMHAHLLVLENGHSVRRLRQLERLLANLKRLATATVLVSILLGGVVFHLFREHRFSLETRQRQLGSDLANGAAAIDSGDYLAAVPFLVDGLALDEGDSGRAANDRLRIGSVLAHSPKLVQMFFAPVEVTRMLLTPDGTKVLVAERDGQAQLYDPLSSRALTAKFGRRIHAVSISPDGKWVALSGADQEAGIYSLADASQVRVLQLGSATDAIQFAPDSRWLATMSVDRKARIWDMNSQQTNASVTFTRHRDSEGTAITFSPDGKKVASATRTGEVWIWDPRTGEPLEGRLLHKGWVSALDFSRDGDTLLVACENDVHVWDLSAQPPREIMPRLSHADRVFSTQFSPDGRWILTGVLDGTARLWGADSHQLLSSISTLRQSSRVVSAAFGVDGRRILTGSIDGTGRIWDLASLISGPTARPEIFCEAGTRFLIRTNQQLQLHDARTGLAVAAPYSLEDRLNFRVDGHGQWLICTDTNTAPNTNWTLEVRNAGTGVPAALSIPFKATTNRNERFALTESGSLLGFAQGTNAQLYQISSGAPASPQWSHPGQIESVFFSRDGRLFGVLGRRWIKVWNVAGGGEQFPILQITTNDLRQAVFSPDSRLLMIRTEQEGFDATPVSIRDARTGQLLAEVRHRDGIVFVGFSPDSKRIVTAGEDFSAIIWEARTGRRLALPLRHRDQVLSAVFSDDGKWVLTASNDKTARLWDAETGDPLTPPMLHLYPVRRAIFLPGNHRILTQDVRGNYWSWNLAPDDKPLNDLTAMAVLLAGDSTALPVHLQKVTDPIADLWHRLSAAYPADFSVSNEEAAAWHDYAARQCEEDGQFDAASFHLRQLLRLKPGDPEAQGRLQSIAQRQLTKARPLR